MYRKTFLKINLDAIKYNLEAIQAVQKKKAIAVLKANAYGCGAKEISEKTDDMACWVRLVYRTGHRHKMDRRLCCGRDRRTAFPESLGFPGRLEPMEGAGFVFEKAVPVVHLMLPSCSGSGVSVSVHPVYKGESGSESV